MSAIYGIVDVDRAPVDRATFAAMGAALETFGPDGGGDWHGEGVALGQRILATTAEAWSDLMPHRFPDRIVVAAGRLDNRGDLARELALDPAAGDGRVIAEAARRWGEAAPGHLFGDWAFAAWDPRTRRLVLARDHLGNTALYYHFDGRRFAFATGRNALFAWPHVERRLNERPLAEHLALSINDGAQTLHKGILRLPPGHVAAIDATGVRVSRYWRPETVTEIRLKTDDAYIERFLELYSAAVATRMRAAGPVATTLSAGLDSGSVTALAAIEARRRGQHLIAFTARPRFPIEDASPGAPLYDEWPFAQRSAAYSGIEAHHPILASDITPLQAMRRSLAAHGEPEYAAANLDWIHDLLASARRHGARVLLTGQMGNGGISWAGDRHAIVRPLLAGQIAQAARALRTARRDDGISVPRALWRHVLWPIRAAAAGKMARHGLHRGPPRGGGLINPRFAARMQIAARRRAGGHDPMEGAIATPLQQRFDILLPGITPIGALSHETGAAYGIDMRDPTVDIRLLEFCLAVPPDQYRRGGMGRSLIRRAMRGRMPPETLSNTRQGRQGGDFAARLHADAEEMEAVVAQLAADPMVQAYLNVPLMQARWQRLRVDPAAIPMHEAFAFGRGVQFGLFLSEGF